MNKQGQNEISKFLRDYSKKLKIETKVLFSFSNFQNLNFELIQFDEIIIKSDKIIENNFDLAFVDLPFGMNREQSLLNENKKIRKNWNLLIKSLKAIKTNGILFTVIEPTIYYYEEGKEFLKSLESVNFYCNLIINAPNKLYYPHTSFRPIIIGFQKEKADKLFIAELTGNNVEVIIDNLIRCTNESLENGKYVERQSFTTFPKERIKNEIFGLQTQYKDYKQYVLSEIVVEINTTRDKFKDLPNSIYLPKIGTSKVVSELNELKIKHQNVFQIRLKKEFALAEYVAIFYDSELGRLIRNSLITGAFIPQISKSIIKESEIAIPPLAEQRLLIHTNQKLTELQTMINELKNELGLNPKHANDILEKFDTIVSPFKKLNSEDEILSIIRKGENKKIEFKQTFSKNIHTLRKDKEIEKSSLKNIVGFLNSEGGTLLIGVADNREITGIEDDYFKSNDNYLLNFKNALNTKIGPEFYPLINYDIFQVLDKKVLRVDCKPSRQACFYNENEFYVRTNPSTDRLEGRKLIEYIKRRFKD